MRKFRRAAAVCLLLLLLPISLNAAEREALVIFCAASGGDLYGKTVLAEEMLRRCAESPIPTRMSVILESAGYAPVRVTARDRREAEFALRLALLRGKIPISS